MVVRFHSVKRQSTGEIDMRDVGDVGGEVAGIDGQIFSFGYTIDRRWRGERAAARATRKDQLDA
jgi:hypothetical protein